MSKAVFEKELKYEARLSNLTDLTAQIDLLLEQMDCSVKIQTQIDVSIDEIFTNICSYAYQDKTGSAIVRVEGYENPKRLCICFTDEGIPYNPLEKEDPDINLSVEERPIGGLGIFMVKSMMDDMQYEYRDGKNVLTLFKNIE